MGIKGLSSALKTLVSQAQLHGRAVIDGPGLAFFIHSLARSLAGSSTVLDEPSSAMLVELAIQWLDELQSGGVNIAAIYFDGYLPTSKTETRIQRLCERSHEANNYFLATVSGTHTVISRNVSGSSSQRLPINPFIVPAVLEALRSLDRYAVLTHLVPGEADPYCARDVCLNGGTLLTGDSDFLLYDLGATGTVAFFRDVCVTPQLRDDGKKVSLISALRYDPVDICRKLSLEPGQQGMLAAAFEITSSPVKTYKALTATPRSQWQYLEPAQADKFADFSAEYMVAPGELRSKPDYLKYTDPRVAEFILDWAAVAGFNATPSLSQSSPASPIPSAPRDPVVHLPLLIDRWDMGTGWNASTVIRQLAYSLCRSGGDAISTITEYRRTLSLYSAGQAVELLAASEVPDVLRDTLSYTLEFIQESAGIAKMQTTTTTTRLRWITACLGFEIGQAASEGKESTTVKLLRKASTARSGVEGLLDPRNWDVIHLVAIIQGVLYSLRMLRQVLMCQIGEIFTRSDTDGRLNEMRDCLASLPCIAEYPCLAEMEYLFEQLDQAGAFKKLSAVVGIKEPSFGKTGKGSGRAGKTGAKQQRKHSNKAAGLSNPFDALAMDD
ncbi:XPG domain containing-domain-containing protein [Coniella lustricola]|uniref:XPG domain containing-domain-containing protein n=1 Tax=Coniella lustricola TaxID=2025994 RepID=A0A2T3AKN8_9PEZI|nr:XPG domain containing-domain-containing protein [Coniella lustricola]